MCGILGFFADSQRGTPDQKTFEATAKETAVRGPQAWGLATIDGNGIMRMYKAKGDVRHCLATAWAMVKRSRAFIMHCRWQTHGGLDNLNNHPHHIDGGWLIHNGQVKNYDRLKGTTSGLISACDSEVICRIAENTPGRLPDRLKGAIDATTGNLAIAALWRRPDVLVIARRGNPLSTSRLDDGLWFSSLGGGHQGESMPDDSLLEYRFRENRPGVYRRRKLESGKGVYSGTFDHSGSIIAPRHQGSLFREQHYQPVGHEGRTLTTMTEEELEEMAARHDEWKRETDEKEARWAERQSKFDEYWER